MYKRGGVFNYMVLLYETCQHIWQYLKECHKNLMIGFHQQQLLMVKLEITLFIEWLLNECVVVSSQVSIGSHSGENKISSILIYYYYDIIDGSSTCCNNKMNIYEYPWIMHETIVFSTIVYPHAFFMCKFMGMGESWYEDDVIYLVLSRQFNRQLGLESFLFQKRKLCSLVHFTMWTTGI